MKNEKSYEQVSEVVSEKVFMDKYEKLKSFIDENKKFPSLHSKNKEEKILGQWISEQRRKYKNHSLSRKNVSLLDSLSKWEWKIDHVKIWKGRLKELKQFVADNGRMPTDVSKNLEEDKLRCWYNKQLDLYESGKLSSKKFHLVRSVIKGEKMEKQDFLDRWYKKELKSYRDNKMGIKENNEFSMKHMSDEWIESVKSIKGDYSIYDYLVENDDGTYDYNDICNISMLHLSKIPIKFNKVKNFTCAANPLKDLTNSPEIVEEHFSCWCTSITSLKGIPKQVGGNFDCSGMYYIDDLGHVVDDGMKFTEKEIRDVCEVKGKVWVSKPNK